MITQEEINNTVVDVVYDKDNIIHVLEPNLDGVRGVSANHFMVRNTIENVSGYLAYHGYDLIKIEDFKNELNSTHSKQQ